ncbi:hypothetical protein K4L44_16240 [Halosquirtibacter laminarini]|uniref:Uncharacterized protein n=1 Tax=Halosquirtibacter laminarini TaxID=3374600 RepID=A0AC61NMU5_9BACT|nr:hypothetical protein K4L44_16240 [Prolixibacteraceae bacterium]
MKYIICMFGFCLFVLLEGCTYNDIEYQELKQVSFKNDIVPIFENSCTSCHKSQSSIFSLEPTEAYKSLQKEKLIEEKETRLLLKLYEGHPTKSTLNENQLKKIELWIKEGALEN